MPNPKSNQSPSPKSQAIPSAKSQPTRKPQRNPRSQIPHLPRALPIARFGISVGISVGISLGIWELEVSWDLGFGIRDFERVLQLRHERIELHRHRADRVGLRQVDTGALQERDWIVVAAGL